MITNMLKFVKIKMYICIWRNNRERGRIGAGERMAVDFLPDCSLRRLSQWSLEPEASARSLKWLSGIQNLGHLLLIFMYPMQGSGVEHSGLESAPTWDASVSGCSSPPTLTMLILSFILVKPKEIACITMAVSWYLCWHVQRQMCQDFTRRVMVGL